MQSQCGTCSVRCSFRTRVHFMYRASILYGTGVTISYPRPLYQARCVGVGPTCISLPGETSYSYTFLSIWGCLPAWTPSLCGQMGSNTWKLSDMELHCPYQFLFLYTSCQDSHLQTGRIYLPIRCNIPFSTNLKAYERTL